MALVRARGGASGQSLAEAEADVVQHQEQARIYLPKLYSNDPELTEIDLTGSGCNDIAVMGLCDALRSNTVVRSLTLDSNWLSDSGAKLLSEVLEVNSSLTFLSLEKNVISTDGAKALAVAMEGNTTLAVIQINDNDPEMDEEVYTELVTMTKLNSHPQALKEIILKLRRGQIGDTIDLSRQQQSADPTIVTRDVEHDAKMQLDDWSCRMLAEAMSGNNTVKLLDLSHQHVGDEGAFAIARLLEHNQKLDRINLNGNCIAAAGAMSFVDALKANNTLCRIDLFNNLVSEQVLFDVEAALSLNRLPLTLKFHFPSLKENDPSLAHLQLDDHACQRKYDDIALRLISDQLRGNNNTHLMSLAINHSAITTIGCRFLSDALSTNRSLKNLNLDHNPIQDGGYYIAQALANHSDQPLECLSLANCELTESSAQELATMLANNKHLTELDLSDNPNVGLAGPAIADAFIINTTMLHLRLENTSIDPKFLALIEERRNLAQEPQRLREILPALHAKKEGLKVVNLSGDSPGASDGIPLRNVSLRLISAALKENFVVTDLDLSKNKIGYDGVTALAGSLLENRVTLHSLNLSDNPTIGGSQHGYEFGGLIAGMVKTHCALQHIQIRNTGLDEEGCLRIIQRVGTRQQNMVKTIDVSGNPQVAPATTAKLRMFLKCNSLLPALKPALLDFWSQWEEYDSRAVYTLKLTADFKNYGQNSIDPKDVPQAECDGGVRVICEAMGRVKGYSTLNLASNYMTDESADAVAELLAADTGIQHLDLSGNRLGDAGVAKLIQGVKRGYSINTIKIRPGNPDISESVAHALSVALVYNEQSKDVKDLLFYISGNKPEVPEVDFSNQMRNHLSDHHVELLCDALKDNSYVETINLSNNHIHAEGFAMLVDCMKNNPACRVSKFCLSNTLVDGPTVGPTLAIALSSLPSLTHLDLSHCEIGSDVDSEQQRQVLEAVRTNSTMKVLNLQGTGIDASLQQLVTNSVALNTQSDLKELVAKIRRNDPSVTEVNGADRGYTNAQVSDVFDALRDNTMVHTVDFCRNKLTDACGTEVMRCLTSVDRTDGVHHINLAGNEMTGVTLQALTKAMATNRSVRSFDFSNNGLQRSELDCLEELLGHNEVLHTFTASGNKFNVADEDPESSIIHMVGLNKQHCIKNVLSLLRRNDPKVTCVHSQPLRALGGSGDPVLSDEVEMMHYQSLQLPCVEHDSVGARLLGRALTYSDFLTHILLPNGTITDSGCEVLCQGLQVNRSVLVLDLSCNRLGDLGVKAVADVLKVNKVIKHVRLDGNRDVTQDGRQACLVALALNGDVESLHVEAVEVPNEELHPCFFSNNIDLASGGVQNTLVPNTSSLDRLTQSPTAGLNKTVDTNSVAAVAAAHQLRMHPLDGVEHLQKIASIEDEEERHLAKEVLLNKRHPNFKHFMTYQHEQVFTELDLSSAGNYGKSFDNTACELLCATLADNKFITRINLSNNQIGFDASYAIGRMLMHNKRLTELNLAHNKLVDGSANIVDALKVNTSLTVLNLNGNGCSAHTLEKLNLLLTLNTEPLKMKPVVLKMLEADVTQSSVVLRTPEIEILENRKPQLDDESVLRITMILQTDLIVVDLDLSWNAIRDTGLNSIANLVKQNSGLRKINLAHNFVTDEGLTELCSAWSKSEHLEEVDLRHNLISNARTDQLRHLAENKSTCKALHLEGNRIKMKTLEVLRFLCDTNKHTQDADNFRQQLMSYQQNSAEISTKADLSGYQSQGWWNSYSMTLVGYALKRNTFVTELYLEYNDIHDNELINVVAMVQSNTTLRTLSLAHNYFRDVDTFCEAMVDSPITTLDLRGNRLTVESAKAIAVLLGKSDTLKDLDISKNSFGHIGVTLIVSVVPMNEGLEKLRVEGPGISEQLVERAEHSVGLKYKNIKIEEDEEAAANDDAADNNGLGGGIINPNDQPPGLGENNKMSGKRSHRASVTLTLPTDQW